MYYAPKNADAADSVLQVLQAQLEQNRMRQRVRKKSRQTDSGPDHLPIPDTPGQRIVYLRKQRKITQKTLADAVGITSSTLSKYETGNCPFRTDLLIRFARELATTTDFLLCLTDRIMVDGVTAMLEPEEIPEVYLDRPFVFMIVDTDLNLPIFIGRVNTIEEQ